MARGGKRAAETSKAGGMPRFVDVKLTAEERSEFVRAARTAEELVAGLQSLCDDGYRVGCSWSGEHQTYTVSLTGRDPQGVNFGLCMTSFAGTIHTAVALALYKHVTVTEGNWLGGDEDQTEAFG